MCKHVLWILLFLACSLTISPLMLAADESTKTTPSQPAAGATEPKSEKAKDGQRFCPKVETLYKKDMLWHAPGGWRSYGASFVDKVNFFTSTQWIGINIGKIICLYKGQKDSAFPVAIERDNLVTNPTTGKWGDDLGGYKVCKSTNVGDCPFTMGHVDGQDEDIYDLLRGFKEK